VPSAAALYAAAVARRQADQIYNLSLTRTATVILGQGTRRVIGVGRVKTPTLAIVCRRELEIRNFVPIAYFEVVATAKVAGGQFQMRHAPQDRIVRREIAQGVVNAAQDFEGPLAVRVEDKRQGPPKLHDLPSLQKLCGSRFGWPASKTGAAHQAQSGRVETLPAYARPCRRCGHDHRSLAHEEDDCHHHQTGCDDRGGKRSSSREILKNIHRNSKGLMNYYNS
jgi:DNA topoisomerase III